MLLELQRHNYNTWACEVRNVLYRFGFGMVWESQGVGDIKTFVRAFKRRLVDCYHQDWHSALLSHNQYDVYRLYNQSLSLKTYLYSIKNVHWRKASSRLRIGMSSLRSNFLRYFLSHNMDCPFCPGIQENELHFVLKCHKYADLRSNLIPQKFWRNPSMFKLSLLLASTNTHYNNRLSIFVYKAFQLRSQSLLT